MSSSQKSQFASKCLPERKEGRARSVDKFTEEQKGGGVFLCFFLGKRWLAVIPEGGMGLTIGTERGEVRAGVESQMRESSSSLLPSRKIHELVSYGERRKQVREKIFWS